MVERGVLCSVTCFCRFVARCIYFHRNRHRRGPLRALAGAGFGQGMLHWAWEARILAARLHPEEAARTIASAAAPDCQGVSPSAPAAGTPLRGDRAEHRPILSYATRTTSSSPIAAAPVIGSVRAASRATRGGCGAPLPARLPGVRVGPSLAIGLPRTPRRRLAPAEPSQICRIAAVQGHRSVLRERGDRPLAGGAVLG